MQHAYALYAKHFLYYRFAIMKASPIFPKSARKTFSSATVAWWLCHTSGNEGVRFGTPAIATAPLGRAVGVLSDARRGGATTMGPSQLGGGVKWRSSIRPRFRKTEKKQIDLSHIIIMSIHMYIQYACMIYIVLHIKLIRLIWIYYFIYILRAIMDIA